MTRAKSHGIFDAVRSRILDGTLAPGIELRQEALAEQFGVSRIPVREALRSLEAEGLVTQERFQRAIVRSHSLDEILEMLDIRIALETRALRLALPGMRSEDLAGAEAILVRYLASEKPREWSELNLEFHLALYRPSSRPRLVRMIEDGVRGTDRYLRTHISTVVGRDNPHADHERILDACRAGDAAKATSLLEDHIEHTKCALVRAHADT